MALFSETKAGRLTLDCTISTLVPTVPSIRHAEISSDLLHHQSDPGPAESLSRGATSEIDAAEVPADPARIQFKGKHNFFPERIKKSYLVCKVLSQTWPPRLSLQLMFLHIQLHLLLKLLLPSIQLQCHKGDKIQFALQNLSLQKWGNQQP